LHTFQHFTQPLVAQWLAKPFFSFYFLISRYISLRKAAAHNTLNTMGGEQSSYRNGGANQQDTVAAKICYYEVLGIEQQATDEE